MADRSDERKKKKAPEAPDAPAAPDAPEGGEPSDAASSAPPGGRAAAWLRRQALPFAVFAVSATIFAVVTGPRTRGPSPDNHYVHLAESLLNGQLAQLGERPPGYNDWACFDTEANGVCPMSAFQRPREAYRWYVSFPPFPAVVIAPAVAIFGRDFSDPLFWAIFAGLAPALLLALLRRLREERLSLRRPWEELLLVALFAFGSVYFFSSVQGSVWFAAHVVASALLVGFLYFAIGARSPLGAGLMLGLCFVTRPTTAPFALFFLFEAIRASRHAGWTEGRGLVAWLAGTDWVPVLKKSALFAVPILLVGLVAMWMNDARFGDPFEFGHTYLMIRWRPRIEKWGLFNYHYFAKNLSVYLAGLPWLSSTEPYVMISRHGLALWFTSPALLPLLWPKKVSPLMAGLFASTALVAIWDLAYQNSGWVQFGYRFALDYMPMLIVLLALSGRRFRGLFVTALVLSIAVNLFGAITFDRVPMFYDDDGTQDRLFQPD
ncbi:MAG: hypothetical protein KF729_22220 [Sandaracinaceae bacterium]|nr:hypothetical protein [Sandaracinaceae bacterium]